jgi:hypothetical protein
MRFVSISSFNWLLILRRRFFSAVSKDGGIGALMVRDARRTAQARCREDALLTMRELSVRNALIVPKTLAPASGWGTTREDRRASLEHGSL